MPRPVSPPNPERDKEIIALLRAGATRREIANKMRCGQALIARVLQKYAKNEKGLAPESPGRQPDQERRRAIIELRLAGVHRNKIAEQLQCSAVSHYKNLAKICSRQQKWVEHG